MLEQGPDAVAPWESVDSREARLMQEAISALAYSLWRSRGCPEGTPDEDWFNAEEILSINGEVGDSVCQEGSDAFLTQVTLQQSEVSLAEINHNQAVESVREISIDVERHKLAPQL
jgi:hypothetical protein